MAAHGDQSDAPAPEEGAMVAEPNRPISNIVIVIGTLPSHYDDVLSLSRVSIPFL